MTPHFSRAVLRHTHRTSHSRHQTQTDGGVAAADGGGVGTGDFTGSVIAPGGVSGVSGGVSVGVSGGRGDGSHLPHARRVTPRRPFKLPLGLLLGPLPDASVVRGGHEHVTSCVPTGGEDSSFVPNQMVTHCFTPSKA